MKETEFKVRDKVTWTSQAQGYTKKKTGIVVEIVFKNTYPETVLEYGTSRDHTSYVVQVGNKYYWPRVNYLKKVK